MFQKLGIGLAALALMTPGIAAALGLGDYELNSYLNQPLDMEVKLYETGDLSADEILVDLAGETDFQAAGVERTYFLTDLQFEVSMDKDSGGTLRIRSSRPVREPYLNFIIEVLWPTGRMLREYTVLLDPPSFADGETVAPEPAEAVARPVEPRQPARPVERQEQPRPPVAQTTDFEAPVEHDTYEVRADDTMWRIALNHRPSSNVSVQQMLVAIQKLNPDAFIDGNVNLVREGTVLRIPTEQEIRRIKTREALGNIAGQNARWREMLRARGIDPDKAQLDGTPRQVAGADGEGTPSEGQVKLVTDAGEAQGEGTGTGGAGAADASALQNELAIREESLDRLQRENKELASRLDDLENQVQTSEELLELRNQKIARLQEELRQLQKQQGVDVSGELLEPVEKPADVTGEDKPAEPATAQQGAEDAEKAPAEASAKAADDKPAAGQQQAGETAAGKPEQPQQEKTAEAAPAKPAQPAKPARPAQQPEQPKSLVSSILDFIMANLMLLVAGLLVLIALVVGAVLMLRRRGAVDEEEEDALVDIEEDSDDFLPAGLMDDEEDEFGGAPDEESRGQAPAGEGQDPLEEVDVYVAYGRYPQAVDYLRNEINKAPDRSDLKIRLLEVLAEMRDTNGFEQQATALAGIDDEIDARIQALRKELGEGGGGEEEPSLDDLEMDLTADLDSGDRKQAGGAGEDETLVLDAATDTEAGEEEEDFGDFDFSLDEDESEAEPEEPTGSFELDTGDEEEAGDETLELDSGDTESGDLEDLEFSLEDLDTGEEEESGREELSLDELEGEQEEEGAGGSIDFGDQELSLEGFDEEDTGGEEETGDAPAAGSSLDLDDSFDLEGGEDEDFEDLELEDVSSEFSEAAEEPAADELDLSLDDLEEPDAEAEDTEEPPTQVHAAVTDDEEAAGEEPEPAAEETTAREALAEPEPEPEAEPELESEPEPEVEGPGDALSADELLGEDDDDFDFLGDSDENATKLDLAKAYIDMGDAEGARDILNEVLAEGSEQQQSEARELLSQVS